MKISSFALLLGAALTATALAEPFQQAEVTRTLNEVSLLRASQNPRPASIGDVVSGQSAVKTGTDSRAELKFPDATIARIGSNALFRFQTGGRDMDLDGGTMLFSSPKGAGGGKVQAGAVTAAVTGTTFLFSYVVGGEVKVVVLEGKVLVYLTANPKVRRLLRAGQIVTIPHGATTIEAPFTIDLDKLIATSRLLESGGFEPLPDKALLVSVAKTQQGKIQKLPNERVLTQQAAQTARNAVPVSGPKPPTPQVTPPPVPQPTPFIPPPPVVTPPPRPSPTGTLFSGGQ